MLRNSILVSILLPHTKHSQPLKAEDELLESFERFAIVGWVSCGYPIDMFTQEESIDMPSKLVLKNTYASRVRGNSMIDANILDGDVVVIEQSQIAENSERVIVRINEKEVASKTLRLGLGGIK